MVPSFSIGRLAFPALLIVVLTADYLWQVHWLWYAAVVVLWVGYLTAGAFMHRLEVFTPSLSDGHTSRKEFALTFDDGPSPHTAAVLDVLKKHNAPATFFCVGSHAEMYPDILRRIVAEGHTVGNHSYSHGNFFPFLSAGNIAAEIEKTKEVISRLAKVQTNLFRPPFGVTNPSLARAVKTTRQTVIGWNLRSFDTISGAKPDLPVKIAARIEPGSVVLLHDNRQGAADIVERILLLTEKAGYKPVDINRIFGLNTSK